MHFPGHFGGRLSGQIKPANVVIHPELVVLIRECFYLDLPPRTSVLMRTRELCVVIDGEEGCCPIGEDCTFGGALECEDSSQILCDGLDFCCRTYHYCHI